MALKTVILGDLFTSLMDWDADTCYSPGPFPHGIIPKPKIFNPRRYADIREIVSAVLEASFAVYS